MRFVILAIAFLLFFSSTLVVAAGNDIAQHPACAHCGMDRGKFASSRMLLISTTGQETGVCSLHCAAVTLATSADPWPKALLVADFDNKNLIAAESAVWVVGGNKPAVMSRRAKWAFTDRVGGEAFVAANGGSLIDFETALDYAYEDMGADVKMMRELRAQKRQPRQQPQSVEKTMPSATHPAEGY